jgi:hypothetical protein
MTLLSTIPSPYDYPKVVRTSFFPGEITLKDQLAVLEEDLLTITEAYKDCIHENR